MLDTSKIPTKRVDGYYTHITNCITKIPQNIKLELNNGSLTLKAGSKVCVPNGAGVFDEVVVKSDINFTYTYAPSTNIQCMLFIDNTGTVFRHTGIVDDCFSGSTQPSGSYKIWYNTTENKMYSIGSNATIDGSGFSFPIAIITQGSDGATKSIDQFFNGFGYIGNTIFVLPGVEGIIPNGFNEDGSIKNIHCQIEEVRTKQTLNGWNNHWYVHLMGEDLIEYHPWELYYNQVDKPMSVGQTAYWYNPNEKIVQSTDDFGTTWNTTRQVTPFLEVFQNGETITSIKPINVYENITSKTVENKFKVVSELPSFPEVGVFYFVKE